ncbi:MAG TPA: ABC transporter permease, partial [Puia sp.]|nr:ABC transporter permease [Puia sp.]
MLRNYFHAAWRTLRKYPAFSLINICGLAIALAVCMLMLEYVQHERSYDRFHNNSDRICWVQSKVVLNNDSFFTPAVNYQAAPIVKARVPAVEDFVRLKKERDPIVVQNILRPDVRFSEPNVAFADSNFFRFFSFKLLSGSKDNVLREPYTVVISQGIARKYFGTLDPIGKILRFNNETNFVVRGVAENAPSNSSITYDFIASMPSLATYHRGDELKATEFASYFLLRRPSDARQVEQTMAELAREDQGLAKINIRYIATMLPQTHLDPNYGDSSNVKYLAILPFVVALILLLAVINYSSLSTAGATARAKEIGVRKMVGASRQDIAVQFFTESGVLTAVAFLLAFGLCAACQPAFSRFLDIGIGYRFFYGANVLAAFCGLLLVAVTLAAVYPALVLSAFRPLQALYGKMSNGAGRLTLRQLFTVFQFTIAVAIMICGLVIRRQMDFFRHSDTGLRRSNIVMIPFSPTVGRSYAALKKDLQSLPAVEDISTSSYPMYMNYDVSVIPPQKGRGFIPLPSLHVDANFIPMLGIRWKISPVDSTYPRHPGYAVVNEAAVEKIGLKGDPLNQAVNGQFTVAGVVKDFDFASLQNKIDAMVLTFNKDEDTASGWARDGGCLFAKIRVGTDVPNFIRKTNRIFSKYDANAPFEYYFMDDVFNRMYSAEDKLARIFTAFTLFTVVLACLGLLGMSIFAAS